MGTVLHSSYWPTGLKNLVDVISNGTDAEHDIDVTAGIHMWDSTNTKILTSTAMTKRIDAAWSAGTGNGGLFAGTVAANMTYYYFMIYNPTTKVTDFGFNVYLNPNDRPSGYTYYSLLWAVKTDSSSNIIPFTQYGLYNEWVTPISNYSGSAVASKTAVTMSTPNAIVTKVKFQASLHAESVAFNNTTSFFSANQADAAPSVDGCDIQIAGNSGYDAGQVDEYGYASGNFERYTNTASQIYHRTNNTAPELTIYTLGFEFLTIQ